MFIKIVVQNMITLLFTIIISAGLGFFYGYFFIKRVEKIYRLRENYPENLAEKEFKRFRVKKVFNFTFSSILGNILAILFFMFLIFFLNVNILVVFIIFMIAFWGYILLGINKKDKKA